ncbi:flap endonuclease GEN homolog 1 isoform X2 [Amia ocellicauda]|uniref:flap endonuclease GEN homolog 1 isoform X2 n=1 Tax=Amia ocellicauda TaxID=2972642 RepID=UPI003464251A
MGVNELWPILEPVRESVPLYSLRGLTFAVDLSLWVCEAQFVKEMAGKVTKPHLRNLFFRVSSLTLMGIKLIFVMEGEAPKLKAETMNKRNELRFGHSKKPVSKPTKTGRSHFRSVLKECAEMLDCLGIPWVTATGEAEAMCAYLDINGFVDGCITNDGDAFLYGAQTVYRNFNMNSKDPQLDCYKMQKVKSKLYLERETLVGLAVLLGCDYLPKGIPGVGKELSLKLIDALKGETLLEKFNQWKMHLPVFENKEKAVKKVTHCLVCHHPGSAKTHERSGCNLCNSSHFCEPQDYDYSCPCDWHQAERGRQANAVELTVKRKALACEGFPFPEIIKEFLVSKDKPVTNIKWRKPNLSLMQKFAFEKLDWPKHYTSEKVLVLVTYAEMINRKSGRDMTAQIQPIRVFKPRVRNGISCLEIIWKKPEHYTYAEDVPVASQTTVRTIEEESLFRSVYPEVIELFLKEKAEAEENKQKHKKRKPKEQKTESDDVSDLFAQMRIQSSSEGNSETAAGATPDSPTVAATDDATYRQPLGSPLSSKVTPSQRESVCEDHTKEKKEAADCPPSPVPSDEPSLTAASPLESVIEKLQLSDIDWAATSFGASPSPQVPPAPLLALQHTGDLAPVKGRSYDNPLKRTDICTGVSKDFHFRKIPIKPTTQPTERFSNPGSSLPVSELSFRDRVLMKNTQQCFNTNVSLSNPLKDATPVEHNNAAPKSLKLPAQQIGKAIHTEKESASALETLLATGPRPCSEQNTGFSIPRPKTTRTNHKATGENFHRETSTVKPSYKTQSVKPSSRAQIPKGGKKKAIKKSVCQSLSASEDSDAENVQLVVKTTVGFKTKASSASYIDDKKPNKTISYSGSGNAVVRDVHIVSRIASTEAPVSRQNHIAEHDVSARTGDSVCARRGDAPARCALSPGPGSPAPDAAGEDSLISLDSPLPLAQRLRLKFGK